MQCATAQFERPLEQPGSGEQTPIDLGVEADLKAVAPRRSEGDGDEVLANRAQSNGDGRTAHDLLPAAPEADRPEERDAFGVSFPEAGRIVFRSRSRFKSWNHPWVREFIETSFGVREVRSVILVKDGRALERMRQVDTVLFDKTGTLTRERPEVHRVFCHGRHTEDEILTWAAAAEQRFSHPIAQAVLERFRRLDRPIPALDSSKYKVGYGITVELEGRTVRVGSRRFMDQEKIPVPDAFDSQMQRLHADGHSFVCVATEDNFAGVLELRTSHRSEAEEIVAGLRARGIDHIAIVSGDHEKPTYRLARQLGMDRHFAEVLPHEKGRYIELLQKKGAHRLLCRRWHQRRDCAEEGGCLYFAARSLNDCHGCRPDCVHEGKSVARL